MEDSSCSINAKADMTKKQLVRSDFLHSAPSVMEGKVLSSGCVYRGARKCEKFIPNTISLAPSILIKQMIARSIALEKYSGHFDG